MRSSDELLLKVRQLRLRYGANEVLSEVNFDLKVGESLGLVGESGSGKTTTALALIQLLPNQAKLSGSIQYYPAVEAPSGERHRGVQELVDLPESQMARWRGREIGMVFQDALAALNPVRRLGAQLMEVLWVHQQLRGGAAKTKAIEWLERVGLAPAKNYLASYPHQLSGGQRQRALIALALACKPRLLICDEPTSALDVTVQQQVIALLKQLREQEQLSLLFISHDLALTAELCDRIAVMRKGQVVEIASAPQIWYQPQHPYTQGLLACRPKLHSNPVRLLTVADFEAGVSELPSTAESDSTGQTRQQLLASAPILLEVQGLSAAYPARGWTRWFKPANTVVQDIHFVLKRGECLGIVGESGSGKTTLARCLIRLHKPSAGRVQLSGTDLLSPQGRALRQLRRRFQMVFQDPYSALNPALSIWQTLLEPLQVHGLYLDRPRERVLELLHAVGLPESALLRKPAEFSGGQRQRIAIARALAVQPELLICDESVSALDVSVQAQILNLLKDLQAQFGLTIIFISHDLSVIRFMADQVLVMAQGRAVEQGPCEQIFKAPQHGITKQLLDAVPKGI